MNAEAQYLNVLESLLSQPVRGDRTGTGTRSKFGVQLRFDISRKFPLLTTKKVGLKLIFHELKWMLMGDTNIKYLVDNNVNLWNDWPLKHLNTIREKEGAVPLPMDVFIDVIKRDAEFARRWGDCGPVYGFQWRKWPTFNERSEEYGQPKDAIDQIADVLYELRTKPESRRMIVSAWNVADIPAMIPTGLPPCHMMMQFYTRPIPLEQRLESIYPSPETVRNKYLDCQVYIRSNDWFLGAPFNMVQYSLLTHLMANCVNMLPGELIYTVGDAHLYLNHQEQAREQLSRTPNPLPTLKINRYLSDPVDINWEDIELSGYLPHDAIKAPVAV